MQKISHLIIKGQVIKVLVRLPSLRATYQSLKIRKSEELGDYLEAESYFLEEKPVLLEALIRGKVIKC